MACDFTIAQDMARFGQAGPKHGSAPDGGSTDFLPLYVGVEAAMESCTVCDPWSAHKAFRLGLLTQIVPVLKVDGAYVPNPTVVTDRWVDAFGNIVYGEPKTGEALDAEAFGNWGCDPALYPECLDLILDGKVKLGPFLERLPMSEIADAFDRVHHGRIPGRVVLLPQS